MRYLDQSEQQKLLSLFNDAAALALNSNCEEAQYGAIIFNENGILGQGYNHVADVVAKEYSCHVDCPRNGSDLHKGVGLELCISTHAEEAAIDDMLFVKNIGREQSAAAKMLVVRMKEGEVLKPAAIDPYCTRCAGKIAAETLIKEVLFPVEKGIVGFDSKEFFILSIGNLYKSWKEMVPSSIK